LNTISHRVKYKILLQTAAIAAALSACAQPQKEMPSTVSPNAESETDPETLEFETPQNEQSASVDETMATHEKERLNPDAKTLLDDPIEYWVKRPGTAVYDSKRELARSLRLQPKVTVYKEVEGWGLISTDADEWVNMSDITLTQPDGVLARPEESTGRPRIKLEDMLKSDNK